MDSEANIARIADFGLAKRLTEQGLTTEGSVAGTPCFMSPEQAQAQELTPQSDLFSLGSVLYVAASGELPFSGDNAYVILDQIRNKTPSPLSELRSDIPTWFSDLIARLMEKDVKNRIDSAETITEVIQNQHLPEIKNAARSRSRLKARMIVATIASVLVALAAYGGWKATRPPAVIVEANQSQTSATESANSNAATRAPFFVTELKKSFENLNEAVVAAAHGSTIVIQSDGPFLVEPIDLGNKELSLIAAPDRRPEFRPAKSSEESLDAFIKTRADLRLKGLVIDWPIEAETKMDVIGQAIIIMEGTKLSLSDCTLKSGKGASCIQMTSGLVELDNVHLISQSGSCVGARYGALELHGTNVLFEGRNAIMLVNSLVTTSSSVASEITLERSSVRAERFLNIVTPRPPRERLALKLNGVVLDCSTVVVVVGGASPMRDVSQVNSLGEVFAALVSWSDRGSIYNRQASFLSYAIWRAPLQTVNGNVADLASWKALFKDEMGGSITAEILSSSPTKPGQPLHQFTELSGTIPEQCGVDTWKLR
jgi:Protein kinase domain